MLLTNQCGALQNRALGHNSTGYRHDFAGVLCRHRLPATRIVVNVRKCLPGTNKNNQEQ